MAIKSLTQVLTDFTNSGPRQITAEMLRDFANSVIGVAGTLYASDVSVAVTTAWAAIQFTNSIDTKGLTPELADGRFLIESGAGGVYKVEASLCFDSASNGEIQLALVKNGALTPYVTTYSVIAGKKLALPLSGTGNLADGDTIGVAIKASGNATPPLSTVTLVHGSLIATRI